MAWQDKASEILREKIFPSKWMEWLVPGSNAMADRLDMMDLYDDPNWMLQAGLGDIEFEQDMYDDIVYGKPAIDKTGIGPAGAVNKMRFPEGWEESLQAFPDDPYDKLALAGLRKHAMEGGSHRYIDETPFNVGEYEEALWPGESERGYQGRYTHGFFGPNIDINPDYLLPKWDWFNHPKWGSRQDKISDVYRHEYKHGLFPYGQPFAHPIIYGTGAKYGLSGEDVGESLYRFVEGPLTYGEDYFGRRVDPGGYSTAAGMTHPYKPQFMPEMPAGMSPMSPQDRAGDVARHYISNAPLNRFELGNVINAPGTTTSPAPDLDVIRELQQGFPIQRGRGPSRAQQRLNTGGLASLML